MGIDFRWLELFRRSNDKQRDTRKLYLFIERFKRFNLHENIIIATYPASCHRPCRSDLEFPNVSEQIVDRFIEDADYLWNFHASMPPQLLAMFKRKILLDLDPGHLQVSAPQSGLNISCHDTYFSVGLNILGKDCLVPHLGFEWKPFFPPIHLNYWRNAANVHPTNAFTSITQWNWGELHWGGHSLSVSKRDAYMRYIETPSLAGIPIELAANIGSKEVDNRDRAELSKFGWSVVMPHTRVRSLTMYRSYIQQSFGEFGCAKPVFVKLRTGWFSDRTAAYLAAGRPVVIEKTGIPANISLGDGILTFSTPEEAVHQLQSCTSNYQQRSSQAVAFAERYLDSSKVLSSIIEQS
ncbi:hypothetical protein KBZ01_10695 [Synechococcus sp. Edmonson 11F2]|nr:hypothetical protein [Synechococcus sp. Edmonson 11F2]